MVQHFCHKDTLKTEESLNIRIKCLIRVETWSDDITVSENAQIGCTHDNARVSFLTLGCSFNKFFQIRLDLTLIRY